ncbi:MAG: hypothetical protein IPJ98_20160 [Bryobacterales bacterium]|nr:hypothetical protein [Bryobacterales bacterium]
MSRVEEIEQAIDGLSAEEFRSLAEWMRERDQELWDRQMDEDSASGKFDALFDEAEAKSRAGVLKAWPPRP